MLESRINFDFDHHESLREMKRFNISDVYYQASIIPCEYISKMLKKHVEKIKTIEKADLKIILNEITYREVNGISITGALRKRTY